MPGSGELIGFALALAGAGAVSGLLAGIFGVGGGAVLVPVLFQVFGMMGVDDSVRMHLSLGTSLAIMIPTSIRSLLAHRKRGAVDMDVLRNWIVAVPLGTLIAAVIAAYVAGEALMAVFATLSLLIALRMFFNRDSWRIGTDLPKNPAKWLAGVIIGILSGLMGVGGGVLNNIFMTIHGRSMHQAVATSSGLGVLISIPGMIGYAWAGWGDALLPPLSTGFVNWVAVALVIPLSLTTAPIGARMAHAMNRRQLEIGFGLFLTVISLRFFYGILG